MATENLTTYTEVEEAGNYITVTVPKCDVVAIPALNLSSYVYKDFGAGHFGDVEHDFEIYLSSADDGASFFFWVLANEVNNVGYLYDGAKKGFGCNWYRSGSNYNIGLLEFSTPIADLYTGSLSTLYYLTGKRAGTTLTIKIYSDAARTVLLDTLTVEGTSDTLRYLYVASTFDQSNPTPLLTGYSQNFDLGVVADVSAGIKIWDGTGYIELVEDNTSPVRIWTGSETIGVKLVATNDPNASAIHIFDGTTTKAFKKKV